MVSFTSSWSWVEAAIPLHLRYPTSAATPPAGLLYLDGNANLATPDTTGSGVLDAMGIAHLLGLADSELARLSSQLRPML